MEATKNKRIAKEPIIHIAKRTNVTFKHSFLSRFIAIIIAIIISAIFIQISEGANIIDLVSSFIYGSFGNYPSFWVMIKETCILLGIALALSLAFKMKYWNTGADGQTLVGCMASYLILYFCVGKMPDFWVLTLALLLSILASIIWSVIPAIFKAFFNTNETLFTLMMNYVAIQLVSFFVNTYGKDNKLFTIDSVYLPMMHQYLTILIIVALLVAFVTVYLKMTKHGYEIAVVGQSTSTAKYAGINVKWVIIRTLILSGVICGIIGFVLTTGLNNTVSTTTLNGRGFTAIIVAWLANFNPLFMILSSFFVIFIQRGGNQLLLNIGCTNAAISGIITSIFFFSIIACTFFINYRIIFKEGSRLERIANKIDEFIQKIGNFIIKINPFKKKTKEIVENNIEDFKNHEEIRENKEQLVVDDTNISATIIEESKKEEE